MFEQFAPFRGEHAGESAILFATGSSVNQFSYHLLPESPDVRVGVNRIICRDDISLDYYFCAHFHDRDHPRDTSFLDKIVDRSKDLQVFCASTFNGDPHPEFFSPGEISQMNAIEYALSDAEGADNFCQDLVSWPMYNHSIVFPALQFLLYTGVIRIYLVGCDCGGPHSCIEGQESLPHDYSGHLMLVENWREFSEFRDQRYPEVEVISVNSRGLRGMFTDYDAQEQT